MNESNVKPWPIPAGRPEVPRPKEIMRPCDYGLRLAVSSLETQLGSIEAYNRLARAANALRDKIEAGKAEAQNPLFAASTGAAEPLPAASFARGNTTCNPHQEAPHGFNRNASHNAGRYVCDCEGWMPPPPLPKEPA